jgi:class 3 adenylate cyclase
MWYIIVETPNKASLRKPLNPGLTSLGRASNNDIVIEDAAASRSHATIEYKAASDEITIIDLNSTNGVFVNHVRIERKTLIKQQDAIRIGQVMLHLENEKTVAPPDKKSHRFTRELVLESVDNHAMLIYEAARKLNTVTNLATALTETGELIKQFMNAGKCAVLLEKDFDKLIPAGFDPEIAWNAIKGKSAEIQPDSMCVPIMSGEDILGLIFLSSGGVERPPFTQRDLQIAAAISHQASLTIQRMKLIELVRSQEQVHRLLLRFVSPTEAEHLLTDYMQSGELPGLNEEHVTVLFSDIANSTAIAEHRGAKEFARVLNAFYQDAAEITFKYGGMIKYLGDGILAIFPASTVANAEEKAVDAGRELIEKMKATGEVDEKRVNVIGVAINSGAAMVGYLGVAERTEFNVLGDVVNVAYRLQEYARPYKIIVGPETVAALGDNYKHRRVGAVYIRGREKSVQAHEVLQ